MKPTTPTKPSIKTRHISKDGLYGLWVLVGTIAAVLAILYFFS